jgi:heme A synthase
VQYNLKDELSKGDRILNIPEIFPKNSEFERLVSFKTPSNTVELRILIVILAGLLAILSFILVISQFWRKKYSPVSIKSSIIILFLTLVLIAYIGVLITNNTIFYFDVPYKHYNSSLISASSYTPFLFIPITIHTRNRLKSDKTKLWVKTTLVLNNIVYLILVLGFGYWGLYNLWN